MCNVKVLLEGVPTTSVYSATPTYWDVNCEKTARGARVYVTRRNDRAYNCHWSVDLLSLVPDDESKRLWADHPEIYTHINASATRDKILSLLWRD